MENLIKKLLVYVDGSEESVTAAQYAICLARISGAELTALYVVNTRAAEELVKANIFLKSEEEEYTRDIEADAERYLNHVKNMGIEKGVTVVTKKKRGTPFLEIKAEVSEQKPDILVLGELSKIRSRRDESYNEAERAMRNVSCSVLIVKDDERVWDLYDSLTP
ncbi:MAG: universal stress protein [Spirochaetaceae bacterium]|nr:MAG: universal stress protein [Spirochaetaceae bacterium]